MRNQQRKGEILTSSVPSPDMAKSGVFADVVPILLSMTMAPFAPIPSRSRAFSENSNKVCKTAQ